MKRDNCLVIAAGTGRATCVGFPETDLPVSGASRMSKQSTTDGGSRRDTATCRRTAGSPASSTVSTRYRAANAATPRGGSRRATRLSCLNDLKLNELAEEVWKSMLAGRRSPTIEAQSTET